MSFTPRLSKLVFVTLLPKGGVASGVARAFPGGRVAHPEVQNEEKNEDKLRKNTGN